MRVTKRDGNLESFDAAKIKRALLLAFNQVHPGEIPNIAPLIVSVMERLRRVVADKTVGVGDVAKATEDELMASGHHDVARAYIIYRHDRDVARARKLSPDPMALPSYIVASKYARYIPALGRREVYSETVDRDMKMHLERFPLLEEEIGRAFEYVRCGGVLPSMRSMQFAGLAVADHNARMYNCSFSLCDRWRVFQEAFYLLLCGCGVGYSVQWRHIDQLSPVLRIDRGCVVHHTVEDTIIGWADALGALVEAFTSSGCWIEFNYSLIRSEGAPLKTSGGRAPGHLPLREALEAIRSLLMGAQGRCIRPIEGSDIMCLLAEAVLAGGIRRASLLGLFDANNDEMIYAKARGNFDPSSGLNGHREMVNLSAALLRGATHRSVFDRLVRVAEENYGDPAFVFVSDLDTGTNPCGEIGLDPRLDGVTGWAFCNLCEINIASCVDESEFLQRCWAASFIGTLQADYTSFPYLGPVSEEIARRDALLGVGICGIQNNRALALDAEVLRAGARRVVSVNAETAARIGINCAARCTTIKPGGTGPLVLGVIGAGIHPGWAARSFRRVTANPLEAVAQEFRRVNPHMVDVKPNGDWSLIFPVEFSGRTLAETTALGFCADVMKVYKNWVLPGTVRPSGGLTHNVSCSVTLRPGERDGVCDYIWENRDSIAAMTFIPYLLDRRFPYAPWAACSSAEDEARWEHLLSQYRAVDWGSFREDSDGTEARLTVACSGGACEL